MSKHLRDRNGADSVACKGRQAVRVTGIFVSVDLDSLAAGRPMEGTIARVSACTEGGVQAALAYAAEITQCSTTISSSSWPEHAERHRRRRAAASTGDTVLIGEVFDSVRGNGPHHTGAANVAPREAAGRERSGRSERTEPGGQEAAS